VLQLSGDALALGTVLALASIPRALFMLVGGALVDRLSPRTVMLASNLARMLLILLLALLVLTDSIQLWMVYLFALAYGTAGAFYLPAQSAIIPTLLNSDQLQIGNTLATGMATLSMFVGPALAGVVIAALSGSPAETTPGTHGMGIAFALDALSFLASVMTLRLIHVHMDRAASSSPTSMIASIKEGMRYVWESPVLRMIFIELIAMNLFMTGPIDVGIPVLADRHLPEGAAAFGMVMSAYGGGWLIGVLLAGVLPKPKPERFGVILLGGLMLLGVGLFLLPFSGSTLAAALITLGMGTGMGFVNIHFTTWSQKRIPEQLMGRFMSLIWLTNIGIMPISSTLTGALLNVNLILTFVSAGVLMTALTLFLMTRPTARQMGLEVEAVERQKASV
jgi:MFS family permease